jgi:hypothetical protein
MKGDKYLTVGILIILTLIAIGMSCTTSMYEGFEDPGYKIASLSLSDIPIIKDVWVINLDKSKDRWNLMIEQTANLDPLPVNRWPATDGRAMTNQDYIDEKIPIIIRPADAAENLKERRKGEIGCYLSHKKLLESLGKQKVSDASGHLILEDDVLIDRDTLMKWKDVADKLVKLDKKWDIFFFGIHDPVLGDVKDGIAPVKSIQSLHAYMVRHGSIPKILEAIKVMYDPIDEIIRWNADKLKMYAIQPFMIKQRPDFHSDIRGKKT